MHHTWIANQKTLNFLALYIRSTIESLNMFELVPVIEEEDIYFYIGTPW